MVDQGDDRKYFVFDARNLPLGPNQHFAWHPKMPHVGGTWARKSDAQCYALLYPMPGQEDGSDLWIRTASRTVPLYVVGWITPESDFAKTGLVEVAFEYGSDWMTDCYALKAFGGQDMAALRYISLGEYMRLLPGASLAFDELEIACMAAVVKSEEKPQLCGGEGWVCERHPNLPFEHDCCGGAGMPCVCNKANPPWNYSRYSETGGEKQCSALKEKWNGSN